MKQKRQPKKPTQVDSGNKAKGAEDGLQSRNRRWYFPLAALTIVPLILLFVFEFVLRISGFGYPTDFFLPWKSGKQEIVVENDKFAWRFFPRKLARRPPPLSFPSTKPAGTYRIFILGESAAMGDPEPAYGFGRILAVLLQERFPGIHFEIVNTAFTAINSHVILPIARECARQHGDLWIVYMGNNEVMGPFGAGTIFSAQSPPLPVIKTSLALKRLKIGQLADQTIDRWFGSTSQTQSWAGMEMFLEQQLRRDDSRLNRVYEHFQQNLADILRLGQSCGAKVIVSTVASNLKDCAPLASLHSAGLSQDRISEWKKIYQTASDLELAGQWGKAIERFLAAERIDSGYAELQFRLGQCLEALTNRVEAGRRYAFARDLDTLRFRADSRLNEIIKEVSDHRSSEGILLVDAAQKFSGNDGAGIPGDQFFFDHVHLTFEGNYLMALAIGEQALHALRADTNLKDAGQWVSSEVCGKRLALTGWNRYQMYESMFRRLSVAPFTNQLNNASRLQHYKSVLMALRPAFEPVAMEIAVKSYTEAFSRSPDDALLHENFAKLSLARNDLEAASVHLERLTELWPQSSDALFSLGSLLNQRGKSGDAEQCFRRALALNPDFAEAYNGLGSVALGRGDLAQALLDFGKAIQLKPTLWDAHLNRALAFEKKKDPIQAMANLSEAIHLNPNSSAAHIHLGNLLADQGDLMTAMKHYSDATRAQPATVLAEFKEMARLHPNDSAAHFKLASALGALDHREEAFGELAAAVRLNPNFWEARYLIGIEFVAQGKVQEAEAQFREVTRIRPGFALAHLNLGVALAKMSKFDEAANQFHETLRCQPTNHQAREYLQSLQSLTNASASRKQ